MPNPKFTSPRQALAETFNASQNGIELVADYLVTGDIFIRDIVHPNSSYDYDIIDLERVMRYGRFDDLLLDLEPYLQASDFDWHDFEPFLIDHYRMEPAEQDKDERLIGIPLEIAPTMIFYNRDLFDAAGLPHPPHRYGEPYADGEPWTIEKLEEIALLLTLDAHGNNATNPNFDPENIVQFGYHSMWPYELFVSSDTLLDPGITIDKDGNAHLPDRWRQAFHWTYEGMHEKYFIPDIFYVYDRLLETGIPFGSGKVAMAYDSLWLTPYLENVPNWDIAAIPAYDDTGQANVRLDTTGLYAVAATQHPQETVEALLWLTGEGADELLQTKNGFPARKSLRPAFIARLDERFPQNVDWQVALDGLAHATIPDRGPGRTSTHNQVLSRLYEFQELGESNSDLDLDAEIDKLVASLQRTLETE